MKRANDLLKRVFTVSYNQTRTYIENPSLPDGGREYFGFTYYPRNPDEKDPPYEPTKLFLIKRLCKMYGLNPVERKIITRLNIDGPVKFGKHISIVKNIPEVNAYLWKVKHLVTITPIVCPNGLPKDGDTTGTYLRDNGIFTVAEKLKVEPQKIEAHEKYINDSNRFTTLYMRNYLRLQWDNGYNGDC